MAPKAFFVLCATVIVTKTILAQCIGRGGVIALPYESLAYGPTITPYSYGCGDIAASYGGGFAITSTSPIAPTGIIINSDNAIDGTLAVIGNMPFLGSVAMEGVFPTAGTGAVSYGCSDGYIGIVSELPGYGATVAPVSLASAGIAPMGYIDYGVTPYGVAPYGVAPYGVAPYDVAPYGIARYGVAYGGCGYGYGYVPMY